MKNKYMKDESEFDEHDYYNIFVLGYDLLKNLLEKCKVKDTDTTFETCKGIYNWYLATGFARDFNKSEYECLQDFVNENLFEIKTELYNKLDYDIMEGLQND